MPIINTSHPAAGVGFDSVDHSNGEPKASPTQKAALAAIQSASKASATAPLAAPKDAATSPQIRPAVSTTALPASDTDKSPSCAKSCGQGCLDGIRETIGPRELVAIRRSDDDSCAHTAGYVGGATLCYAAIRVVGCVCAVACGALRAAVSR
ncbi:MAG: hypothetical protein K9M07_07750 [Simkaniaceae bacterium]|nr:hypothetical protein [Simkaniaceae bacterium]